MRAFANCLSDMTLLLIKKVYFLKMCTPSVEVRNTTTVLLFMSDFKARKAIPCIHSEAVFVRATMAST